jgi:hypothetical protein
MRPNKKSGIAVGTKEMFFMNNENYRALISGRVHTIGKTDFIVNSFAAAEGSKTAADLIMDLLLPIVKSK